MTTTPREFRVDGLQNDVEIVVDRWGVPHIYGDSRLDVFTAQGFNAARDRLYQIDLWRRRGLGRLAEALGPAHVAQDRATRLFLYRGDMRAEWLAYNTSARAAVTAFVTGVNAYVDWTLDDPEGRLSPEFLALGYRPAHWEPEDIVRIRTHGLLYNVEQELARALTLRDLGPQAEDLRSVREPVSPYTGPTDVSLYGSLADSVLDTYRLAFAPVDLGSNTSAEKSTPSGSNNWVIAADRTESGRPLLANDPHRAVTLPSLRYLAHLVSPDMNVIGGGEPNLPGISIGHNEHVAFGLTIWAVDHEDLYIYELNPADPNQYRYQSGWETFTTVEETSTVAGGEDITHTLTFSRHGPVVDVDEQQLRAVAVRAVWLEPGMAPYLGSLEFQDAKDTHEFRAALNRWGAPGVNMLYASTDGDIGWQCSAMVPRRPGWDGSHPVPGDGRYEWDGFALLDELPWVQNPNEGWFSTSNENNLPDGYDSDALTTTTDWYTSGRHERIVEWFEATDKIGVENSLAMQLDATNLHGRRLIRSLSAVSPSRHLDEWKTLCDWDGIEAVDSFAALLYQIWQRRHLRPWLVDTCLNRLGADGDAIAGARHRLLRADTLFSDVRPDQRMVDTFDLSQSEDLALMTEGVETTLAAALAEIEERLGADRSAWTWGNLHRTILRHPVLSRVDVPMEWGELPAVPRAGSGDTVGLTGHDPQFNAVMGSSLRIVMDVGSWDDSRAVNGPGQSGDPRSSHYSDQLDMWAAGDAFPLVYSREAVDAAAEQRIILRAGH